MAATGGEPRLARATKAALLLGRQMKSKIEAPSFTATAVRRARFIALDCIFLKNLFLCLLTYNAETSYCNPSKKLPRRGAIIFQYGSRLHGSTAEKWGARPVGAERSGPVLAVPFERDQLAYCQY